MEICFYSNYPKVNSNVSSVDPWQLMLNDWSAMQNVVEDIEKQLKSPEPNWTAIESDIGRLQKDMNAMIGLVNKYHLKVVSDPNFPQELYTMLSDLGAMSLSIGDRGGFIKYFSDFLSLFSNLRQDILQGGFYY